MRCEYDYCVYNKGGNCLLDEIEINPVGMCGSCEIVNISEEDMELYTEKHLDKIEKTWIKYES